MRVIGLGKRRSNKGYLPCLLVELSSFKESKTKWCIRVSETDSIYWYKTKLPFFLLNYYKLLLASNIKLFSNIFSSQFNSRSYPSWLVYYFKWKDLSESLFLSS